MDRKARVFVNALGNIGKPVLYHALHREGLKVVGVNEPDFLDKKTKQLDMTKGINSLLNQTSRHTRYDWCIAPSHRSNVMDIDGELIPVFATVNPQELPLKDLAVDYVIECSGFYDDKRAVEGKSAARVFLDNGAKRVIQTYPANKSADISMLLGVNHDEYDPEAHRIISNASCTTKSLAPAMKILMDNGYIIANHDMITVHAATASQRVLESLDNIAMHSTGAAKALGIVIPELQGKMSGTSARVPTTDGSISYAVLDLYRLDKNEVTSEGLVKMFESASKDPKYMNRFVVLNNVAEDTRNIVGNTASSILLPSETRVRRSGLHALVAEEMRDVYKATLALGYDNEKGSSFEPVMIAEYISKFDN